MGKSTLYHPISLHVIRGAAEYCGWKFATIKQLYGDPEKCTARYRATIAKIPKEVEGTSPFVMLMHLRECYAQDIAPHWMRQTANGVWMVDLQVDTLASSEELKASEQA